jgi:hypothetical protein
VVEHHLAKVRVASSNLVARSKRKPWSPALFGWSQPPLGDLKTVRWERDGSCYPRVGLIEPVLETVGEPRQEVRVAVEGEPDRRVAELFLDLFGVGPLRDQQTGAGVAQVMKAESGVETGSDHRGLVVALVEVAPQWSALRRCEDVTLGGRVAPEVLAEHIG